MNKCFFSLFLFFCSGPLIELEICVVFFCKSDLQMKGISPTLTLTFPWRVHNFDNRDKTN